MATHLFEQLQRIPSPLEEVFAFFSEAENLSHLSPPWLGFQQLTEGPVPMRRGQEIDYRVRFLGVPLRWTARIRRWDPPMSFEDEQVRGPYKSWVHSHRFERIPGGTMVIDRVRYALPAGWLGEVAHELAIERMLDAIFDYRRRALAAHFGSWPGSDTPASPRTHPRCNFGHPGARRREDTQRIAMTTPVMQRNEILIALR
jgi:ligand-binding SRPBCC domain-containing protein